MNEEMLLECPNCGAIWGMEEIDFQQCDCCGYPNEEYDYEDD
jgi:rubrerythrin